MLGHRALQSLASTRSLCHCFWSRNSFVPKELLVWWNLAQLEKDSSGTEQGTSQGLLLSNLKMMVCSVSVEPGLRNPGVGFYMSQIQCWSCLCEKFSLCLDFQLSPFSAVQPSVSRKTAWISSARICSWPEPLWLKSKKLEFYVRETKVQNGK